MSLVAGDVGLSPDLASSLGQIGTARSKTIRGNYGTAAGQAGSDASARGMSGAGDYNTNRLNATQGLDEGNLESVLGGVLGNSSYQDKLAQRDYGQQMQLANEVGSTAGLSSLEQVLGGVGAATKTGAAISPFVRGNSTPPPQASNTGPLSMYPSGDPYSYGGSYSGYGSYDPFYNENEYSPNKQSLMYQGG